VARFQLFQHLTSAEEQAVLSLARRRKFARGEAVFREGDPGDTVHLIDKGHVAIRVSTPDGDVATVRVLGPGDLMGELAVLDPGPRMATAVALDKVETLTLHRDVIERLRADHTSVDRVLLMASQREVKRLSLALTEVLYTPVATRVARHLVRLTELFAADVVPLTQDDLAGLCGTTRQTVNQVLHDLQQAGVLELARGKVVVVDRARLSRAAR
jgi:CRP/FNR family transcriptional regulator, cyclic AMP receptor protein